MFRRTSFAVLALALLASLILSACQAPAPTPFPTPIPVATQAPTATTAPTAQAEQTKPVLAVEGKSFTLEDLRTFDQISAEVEGTQYKGVRFLDVLKAAGITSGNLLMVASDGYSAGVDVAALTDQCLLAYNQKDGVDVVMPEMDRGLWVREVVEITTEAGGAAKKESASTPAAAKTTSGETRVITDSVDKQVTIPAQVNTVASMRSGITEIICALGQKDKIIAVDEMVKTGESYGEFIAGVYPDLKDRVAPFANKDINVEEMLRLAPDVVLHGGYGRIKQAESLMKQAPSLAVVIAHFETIEEYMNDIRIVAQCVNAEDRAEELIAYLQKTLDDVTARVKDVPAAEKVRVFYGGHDVFHAYTPSTFEHSQIVMAGGVNVAEKLEGWLPEVSPEQLLVWDPQVVILLNGANVDEVLNDKRLASLSAVKNKRVYALPEASWDFSSPRALFCIEWLAAKLYPAKFADLDMEAEADAFYQHVFGVEYTGPALSEGSTSSASSGKRTITDMNGRRVEIPTIVNKVVSLHPDLTYSALALGGDKMLVGVDSVSPKNANLVKLYPAVAKIPDVGAFYSVNQESILLTKPDVILTVAWQKDLDKLQQTLGIPMVCVDSNLYKESLTFIAQIMGAEAQKKAAVFTDYYDDKIGGIAEKISLFSSSKPKVYIAGGSGLLSTYGKESTWQYEVDDAGGVNVAADMVGGGAHEVSIEQVITWNPDVIILDKSCTDKVSALLADARWQSVAAVKNKRVYRAPNGYVDTFGRPHLESALARIWLADKLYGDRLGLKINSETATFYQQCLGVNFSEAEISAILSAAD